MQSGLIVAPDGARTAPFGRRGDGWVIGSWLHGPVLPRNAALADLVLARALREDHTALEPLGDRESRFADLVRLERIAEARGYAKELTP